MEMWEELNKNQKWFSAKDVEGIFVYTVNLYIYIYIYVLALHKKNMSNKNFKLNIGGTDERDLEEAIQNSIKDQQKAQPEVDLKDNKPQIPYFTGTGVQFDKSGIFFIFTQIYINY